MIILKANKWKIAFLTLAGILLTIIMVAGLFVVSLLNIEETEAPYRLNSFSEDRSSFTVQAKKESINHFISIYM
jgi:uncharacterized protein YpmS